MFKNLARGRLAATCLWVTAAAAASSLPARAQPVPPPLKVAFVYVSPVGAAGWTYQHDQGRLAMERALGAAVKTTVVESVAEGPDAERVLRDLAVQGQQLIFATSFGYLEPTLRVATEFPGVRFEHAGGYRTAANVNTYNARYYEARYLAGLLAGRMSKGGVAGYVAGFPVPEVVQGINAFTLGMRAANPAAQVRVLWLNTWFDPAREREAEQALVDQGADVLTNHSGSTAVAQTAEANFKPRGVRFIGYQSDMRRQAPNAQLSAIVHQWGGHYTAVAQAVLAGRWQPRPIWGGMKDGFIALAPLADDVPKAVADELDAARQAIVAGRLQPFGAALDDRAIASMNAFVPGVVGSLPKP